MGSSIVIVIIVGVYIQVASCIINQLSRGAALSSQSLVVPRPCAKVKMLDEANQFSNRAQDSRWKKPQSETQYAQVWPTAPCNRNLGLFKGLVSRVKGCGLGFEV